MPASSHELRVDPSARRNLNHIPERYAVALVAFMDGPLTKSPRRVGKPLRLELSGRWAARVNDYRIVYTVDDECRIVLVLRIEHRADVYRTR